MAGLVRTSRVLLEGIQGILEGGWAAHVPFCDMLPRREVRMLKDTGSTTQFACSSIPSKKRVCGENVIPQLQYLTSLHIDSRVSDTGAS